MALAKHMGLSGKVLFLGFVPHDELPIYYNMADVYVLPSLYEEWSNTIMEAMACGTPVVATDVGGNSYLIKNMETGLLIPPRNPKILAEALSAILDNKELAIKLAENAMREIRKYEFSKMGLMYRSHMLDMLLH